MVSTLGPLFKATFRHAEQLDTRMGIRKDDPRDEREKRGPPEDEPEDNSLWEDSLGVSIESLRVFLINFVEGKTGQVAGEAAAAPLADTTPPVAETRSPQETRHARAANAYQSTADHNADVYHAPPLPAAPQSDVDLVQSEEVRAIHALIADLAALEAAGHTTLTLEKSDSFVQALQDAVSRLKSGV